MFLVTVNLPGYLPDSEGQEFDNELEARIHINDEVKWHLDEGFCTSELPVWTLWEIGNPEPLVESRCGVALIAG